MGIALPTTPQHKCDSRLFQFSFPTHDNLGTYLKPHTSINIKAVDYGAKNHRMTRKQCLLGDVPLLLKG